ncbi:hypothetical protein [Pandoraea sp. SD6-2]|uniref:hypothetical protein n=1 Tax=Pandoraea sp. SD6-2 TaxID=1286093 RepID=UPI00032F1114|nr:hypothetical protein [Pandoraea sp. SD6-2]EON15284.1 hypothetical protein C266_02326 [Pandoraea sp. SD6-2]
MSSLRQHYKEFIIEAQAKLAGLGGYTVPSGERRYIPVAVLRSISVKGNDGFRETPSQDAVVIQITLSDRLDSDPHRALRYAISYARRVIDGLTLPEFNGGFAATGLVACPQTLH